MRRGRQVKCAAGVGGEDDRIGGERVSRPFDSCVSYIVWCLTPDDKVGWCVRRGREVKCAAGVGGDGDCIDFGCQGEWNLVEDLNWVIDIPEWCLKYRRK